MTSIKRVKIDRYFLFCTSMELFSKKDIKEITPLKTFISLCKKKKIQSIQLITPYSEKLGKKEARFLDNNGINVVYQKNFNIKHSKDIIEFGLSKEFNNYIMNLNKNIPIFISCTNFPTKHLLKEGIFSSNSVMFKKIFED